MNDNVIGLIAVFVVVSGAGLIAWALYGRQRLRELAMRERLALIERGLVPSPESDPVAFERLFGMRRHVNPKAERYRTGGVILIGLGAAMFVLIAFTAGEPGIAFGVGGGLGILGIASFVNGTLLSRDQAVEPRPPATPPRITTPEPPTNIAP